MTDERLARALEIFLGCQEAGGDRAATLAAHPDLVDLLVPLFDGDAGAGDDGEAEHATTFGDHRIVREIGCGGAGVVYEAVQRSLGRRVALKVLGEAAGANATQVARLRREALALAQLQHPNIVRVHDVGETGGRHWLAMDLVDGGTLADRIATLRAQGGHRGASLREVVEVVAAIADALEHVHRSGVLHRDVKPSNILLRGDGTPLLSDFGLARSDAAPTVTAVGVIAGTPQYMSPEHLTGGASLTPASDVFSLGATLFEVATLCRAFDGGSTEVVLQQILLQPVPDPRRLQPSLPRDLAAITCRALEKDPARRYHAAGELAADLRAFLDLRPVRARLPSAPRRLWRWLRREPLRAALAAALAVLAVFAVVAAAQLPDLREAAAARAAREYEDALTRGWTLRWSGDRDRCLAEFRRAGALQPHSAEALAHLCFATRAFDGDDAALVVLEHDRAGVDDQQLLQVTSTLLLRMAGRHADAAAGADAAAEPRTATALWLAGTADMIAPGGDAAMARRALERISLAVRLSPAPRLPMVVQWTAAAIVVGDDDALREAHRTLLQLWPEHPQALYHAARALQQLDPARAIELCRRARERGMSEPETRWLELGLWSRIGDDEQIAAAARACLPCTWDDARRSIVLNSLIGHGDVGGAEAAAAEWLQRSPGNVRAQFFLARASADADPARALDVFVDLADRFPDPPVALHALASAQRALGQHAAAVASLRRAIAARSDHGPAHVMLVELLEQQGDADGVLAEWQRWVALFPEDVAAQAGLAIALAKVEPSRLTEALAAALRADELASGSMPEVLDICAELHESLGEVTSAAACRARAATLRAR
ncbi:MAG TPA: protein kinase [Planctomycetota bacterium]|nr:protein kinase [Planctomycetota bacterium]